MARFEDFDGLVSTLQSWSGERVSVGMEWAPASDPIFSISGVLGRGSISQVAHGRLGRIGRAVWTVGDAELTVSTFALLKWEGDGPGTVVATLHDDLLLRVTRSVAVQSVESESSPLPDAESCT
jgi:hypothetical protein